MHFGKEKNRLAVYKHFWSPILSSVSRCDILDFVIIFFCNGSMSDKLRCHDTTKDLVYLSILFWCMWACTWTVIWYHDNQYTSACAEQWRLHDFVIGGTLVSLIYVNAALLHWSSHLYSTSALHPHESSKFCMWSILLSYINSNVPLHRNLGTRFFLRGVGCDIPEF